MPIPPRLVTRGGIRALLWIALCLALVRAGTLAVFSRQVLPGLFGDRVCVFAIFETAVQVLVSVRVNVTRPAGLFEAFYDVLV